MTTERPIRALTLLVAMALSTPLARADWPNWRGPCHNGAFADDLPLPDALDGNSLRWVADLPGPSGATPIVVDGRIYLPSLEQRTDALAALCLDANTGRILWWRKTGTNRRAQGSNSMASCSPVAGAGRVHFLYGEGTLATFDADGRRLWQRDLAQRHGPFTVKFGYSSSPLLHEGKLIIPLLRNENPNRYRKTKALRAYDGPEQKSLLLAVDAQSGRDLWARHRVSDAADESDEAYITPVPFRHAKRTSILIVGGEHVTAHDPADGSERWRWEFVPPDRKIWQRVVTSPVVAGDKVIAVRPKHRPMFALEAPAEKGGSARIAWRMDDRTPDVCTPLYYRGRLYALDGDSRTMTCLDPASGRRIWQEKLPGRRFRSSPLGADGKIYCIGKAGTIVVLAAGDEFRLISQSTVPGEPCFSSIVPCGEGLLVRTSRDLRYFGN